MHGPQKLSIKPFYASSLLSIDIAACILVVWPTVRHEDKAVLRWRLSVVAAIDAVEHTPLTFLHMERTALKPAGHGCVDHRDSFCHRLQ